MVRLCSARCWLVTNIDDGETWEDELPAGAAVFMSADANSKFTHGVPLMPGAGASGSIVGRLITTKVPWAKVHSMVSKKAVVPEASGEAAQCPSDSDEPPTLCEAPEACCTRAFVRE